MSAVIRPETNNQKPLFNQPYYLNPYHPLNRKSLAIILGNERGGQIAFDVSRKLRLGFSGATWHSKGIQCNSNGAAVEMTAPTNLRVGWPVTLAFQATFTAEPVAGGNAIPLFGVATNNSDSSPYVSWGIMYHDTADAIYAMFNSGGSFNNTVWGIRPIVAERLHLAAVVANNFQGIWVNGTLLYSDTISLSNPQYDASALFHIGSQTPVNRNPNFIFEYGECWNRRLSDAEIKEHSRFPFGRPETSPRFIIPPHGFNIFKAITAPASIFLTGSIGSLGNLQRNLRLIKTSSTGTSGIGTFGKAAFRTLASTTGSSGLTLKSSKSVKSGSVTPNSLVLKRSAAVRSGIVSASSVFTKITGSLIEVAGTFTQNGTLFKRDTRSIGGTLTSSSLLVKSPIRRLLGIIGPTSTVTRIKTKIVSLTGTVASAGARIARTITLKVGNLPILGQVGRFFSLPVKNGIFSTGAITLAWDASVGADGYRIYIGTSSGIYTYPGSPVDVGNVLTYRLTNFPSNSYYFVITAYNDDGESGPSNELVDPIFGGIYSAMAFKLVALQTHMASLSVTGNVVRKSFRNYAGILTATATVAVIGGLRITLTGLVTSTGIVLRRTTKFFLASQTSLGQLLKRPFLLKTGVVASIGVALRKPMKLVIATVTAIGTGIFIKVSNFYSIVLVGAVGTLGQLIRQVRRILQGQVSILGLAPLVIKKLITGAVSINGLIIRQANRFMQGFVNISSSVAKFSKRIYTSSMTVISTVILQSLGVRFVSLLGTLPIAGQIVRYMRAARQGSIAPIGQTNKQPRKIPAGSVSIVGSVLALRPFAVIIGGITQISGLLSTVLSQSHFEIIWTDVKNFTKRFTTKLTG